MIKWNRFNTDCRNEWAIFTLWISFTGPLGGHRTYPVIMWGNYWSTGGIILRNIDAFPVTMMLSPQLIQCHFYSVTSFAEQVRNKNMLHKQDYTKQTQRDELRPKNSQLHHYVLHTEKALSASSMTTIKSMYKNLKWQKSQTQQIRLSARTFKKMSENHF